METFCAKFEGLITNLVSLLYDFKNFSHFCKFTEKMAEIWEYVSRSVKDLLKLFYIKFEALNSNLISIFQDSQNLAIFGNFQRKWLKF